jgi:hypothetical protein
MKQREVNITDEEIILAYEKYETLHLASSNLNMTTVTLWRRAKKLGLAWKDKNYSPDKSKIPTDEILEGLSYAISSTTLVPEINKLLE